MIAAVRGEQSLKTKALNILRNPARQFFYSPVLRLEVTLLAAHHGNRDELLFYSSYFKGANCYGDLDRLFEIAEKQAVTHGISVVDSLHVAAAHLTRSILVTGEKDRKPMYRTRIAKICCFRELNS